MAEAKSGWFTGAQHVRNIIISVITTVLGTAAVYYLGFRGGGSSSSDFLVRKDATINAWKSYVTYENIYYKNLKIIYGSEQKEFTREEEVNDLEDQLLNESHKFVDDVEKLAEDKNIDKAFISLLKRRAKVETDAEARFRQFFNNWRTILRRTQPGYERKSQLLQEYTSLQRYSKPVAEEAKNEVVDLAKTLSDTYGQFFSTDDLLLIKEMNNQNNNQNNNNNNNSNANKRWPANDEDRFTNECLRTATPTSGEARAKEYCSCVLGKLEMQYSSYAEAQARMTQADVKSFADQCKGENQNTNNNNQNNNNQNNNTQILTTVNGIDITGIWQTDGGTLYLNQDGTTTWNWRGGQNSSGTWTIKNGNQLYQTITQGYNTGNYMAFNLTNVTNNSFTMQLAYSPFNLFHANRK